MNEQDIIAGLQEDMRKVFTKQDGHTSSQQLANTPLRYLARLSYTSYVVAAFENKLDAQLYVRNKDTEFYEVYDNVDNIVL